MRPTQSPRTNESSTLDILKQMPRPLETGVHRASGECSPIARKVLAFVSAPFIFEMLYNPTSASEPRASVSGTASRRTCLMRVTTSGSCRSDSATTMCEYDDDRYVRVERGRQGRQKPAGFLVRKRPVSGIDGAGKSGVDGCKRHRLKHLGGSFSPP